MPQAMREYLEHYGYRGLTMMLQDIVVEHAGPELFTEISNALARLEQALRAVGEGDN